VQSGKKSAHANVHVCVHTKADVNHYAELVTVLFGLFLGLCLWKFGNPVILDQKISTPVSLTDFRDDPWPTHWAGWILLPLAVAGGLLAWRRKISWPHNPWLWRLPLIWLGWQFISAGKTVDADLSVATLWEFSGCVAAYFLGVFVFAGRRAKILLLIGVWIAFTFCLIKAVDQRLFEFPLNHQMLVEGERDGWTNLPPDVVVGMKKEGIIIQTNGLAVANPTILQKFAKGRVNGTLVYPNALAGTILLLLPAALALVFGFTGQLRPIIRWAAIGLVIGLGGLAFFWTGSKLGWLLGIGLGGMFLLRLDWSKRLKWTAIAAILILGLGVFAVRFHHYFAAGATSVGARFDYWRAAVQTTGDNPVWGTGPGTFQRPYAQIKSP
jgi:hypothetical protein